VRCAAFLAPTAMGWQAYNQWGDYSLYKGPDGRRETRSRAVSFDRPYQQAMSGAGQFLQFELPAVRVAEHAASRWATPPTSTCTPTRTCLMARAPC
jgi:hypothetical protein